MKSVHIIKDFHPNHGPSNVILSASQSDPSNCIIISLKRTYYKDTSRTIISPLTNSLFSFIKFYFLILFKLSIIGKCTIYYHLIHSYALGIINSLFLGHNHFSVLVIHNVEDYFFKSNLFSLLARVIHYCFVVISDKTLCVSRDLVKYSCDYNPLLSSKDAIVIYNGVNSDDYYVSPYYRNMVRTSLNIKVHEFVILLCGHLIHRKNFSFIFENAESIFNKLGIRFTIIVLGEGILKNELKKKSKTNLKFCRTIFCGFSNKPVLFYIAVDLLIIPSLREGFGLVGIESLLCSTPVIAAKVPGLADVLTRCEKSFLYESNDRNDFVNAFTRFLNELHSIKNKCNTECYVPQYFMTKHMSNSYKILTEKLHAR